MKANLAEIQNQLMTLSQDDRLALVTVLWDSIAEMDEALGESSEVLKETLRRNHEFDLGIEKGISHEEVLAEMRRVIDEARIS